MDPCPNPVDTEPCHPIPSSKSGPGGVEVRPPHRIQCDIDLAIPDVQVD